jgi:hypothetical protein
MSGPQRFVAAVFVCTPIAAGVMLLSRTAIENLDRLTQWIRMNQELAGFGAVWIAVFVCLLHKRS